MNFDKNTLIGFSLLAVLFFGYFYYNSIGQQEMELQRKRIADSLALTEKVIPASAKTLPASATPNTKISYQASTLPHVKEEYTTVETDDCKITFSNKGAIPISYKLKHILSFGTETAMISERSFEIKYDVQAHEDKNEMNANDLIFNKGVVSKNADGSQNIEFTHIKKNQALLKHVYTFYPKGYLFDFKIYTNDRVAFFKNPKINITWLTKLQQHEKNLEYEKTQAQVSLFTTKHDFDYFTVGSGSTENIEEPLKWIGVKQQFFNNTLIAQNEITGVKNESTVLPDTINHFFLANQTSFSATFSDSNHLGFQFYLGPTDYKDLSQYHIGLEHIINIGQGFYSFVKYINRGLVIPVFNFLKFYVSNYGIVILLLTVFLRLITAPLLYSSYTSSAKMKLLKPELDELRKKTGGDQQAYAMKQMELYRSAGVNPLGGCIPALLQIPIFLSLYYFFNSCIDLRGQSFLWATDLSSYDSIYNFSFSIPFYGNHVSLFTILNAITSFLISYTGMKNTPDQGNPMLKYMPYIFPVVLLGFFNSLPSSLTWYYTVSNTITLLLQFVIQKYIINHEKLLIQMETKRNEPKKKSSWMQKVEQMQQAQKQAKEAKRLK